MMEVVPNITDDNRDSAADSIIQSCQEAGFGVGESAKFIDPSES